LDNDRRAWESLFAAQTGRVDCLLVDALRSRAARLYPRNEEKQESAVAEFWGQLLVNEPGIPILARYDGQRPLVPWLIRVFQNAHISKLRMRELHSLPDEELGGAVPRNNQRGSAVARCFCSRRPAQHRGAIGIRDIADWFARSLSP